MRARKEFQKSPAALPLDRRAGFDLIESTFDFETARAEANRCLQCATLCDKCVEVCPNRANLSLPAANLELKAWELEFNAAGIKILAQRPYRVRQERQIVHLADFCNECGNCDTFCVHQGKPYLEKPRLFLSEADFRMEMDNAFFVESGANAWSIRRREGGAESVLKFQPSTGLLDYENEALTAAIDSGDFSVKEISLKGQFTGSAFLSDPAEMFAILSGLIRSAAYLPYK